MSGRDIEFLNYFSQSCELAIGQTVWTQVLFGIPYTQN